MSRASQMKKMAESLSMYPMMRASDVAASGVPVSDQVGQQPPPGRGPGPTDPPHGRGLAPGRLLAGVLLALSLAVAPTEAQHSGPLSTYSSLSYGATGAWMVAGDGSTSEAVLATSMAGLAVASTGMHLTEDWGRWPSWESADHAAMHSTYGALAVHSWGAPAWLTGLAALGAPAVEITVNPRVEHVMAVYVGATALAGIVRGEWQRTAAGMGLMGAGLALRMRGNAGHGAWHALTAVGTAVLAEIGGEE